MGRRSHLRFANYDKYLTWERRRQERRAKRIDRFNLCPMNFVPAAVGKNLYALDVSASRLQLLAAQWIHQNNTIHPAGDPRHIDWPKKLVSEAT